MRKHHILYDQLERILEHVSDSPETDRFSTTPAATANSTLYTTTTEALRQFRAAIAKAKTDRSFAIPFEEIEQHFCNFCTNFSTYPSLQKEKFLALILFVRRIASEAIPIDDIDISDNAFELRELPVSIEPIYYSHTNATNFPDSLIAFSIANYPGLKEKVLSPKTQVSLELLYHLCLQLSLTVSIRPSCYALVKRTTPQPDTHSVLAFVKLNIVADGHQFGRLKQYPHTPVIARRDSFALPLDYHQHAEVIDVLNEYNGRQDILSKYLTLYHVFENFMCKAPIVEMERQRKQFSIRDFRALSATIGNELETLQRLFTKTFQEKPDGTTTVSDETLNRWSTYFNKVGGPAADAVLAQLEVKDRGGFLKHTDMADDNIARHLAKIVYQLRNAIVHNKEIDHHLTHAAMSNEIEELLSAVIIPSLERLCFHLLTSSNPHVWYTTKSLLLYK